MPELEPVFIGIAGASRSGKSTLARELSSVWGDQVNWLNFDNYIKPIPEEEWPLIKDWEDASLYDTDRLAEDLSKLSEGKSIEYHKRSWESIAANSQTSVLLAPSKYVLVEGFLLFSNPELRNKFDHKFFIDVSEQLMIERRLASGALGSPLCDMEYINGVLIPSYRRDVLPQKQYSDIILDGSTPTSRLVTQVLERVGV